MRRSSCCSWWASLNPIAPNEAVDRLGDLALAKDRQLIVTNKRLVKTIREQLPELPAAALWASRANAIRR